MHDAIRALGFGLAPKHQTAALAERCYGTAYAALLREDEALAAKLFALFALFRPRDARAWVGLSVCCEQSGLDEAAVGLYRIGAELSADEAHACHLGRARALERLGRLDAARAAHDDAKFAAGHGVRGGNEPGKSRST